MARKVSAGSVALLTLRISTAQIAETQVAARVPAAAKRRAIRQCECLMTDATLPISVQRRKIIVDSDGVEHVVETSTVQLYLAAPTVNPATTRLTKIYDDAQAAGLAVIARVRQRARETREEHRARRRARAHRVRRNIRRRAGLSRVPRRRAASVAVRRATADSGGSSDGDPPPRRPIPRARGPPLSRVGRAAPETTRGTDCSPCSRAVA